MWQPSFHSEIPEFSPFFCLFHLQCFSGDFFIAERTIVSFFLIPYISLAHTYTHTHTCTKPCMQMHAHLLAVMLILMVINDITAACRSMVVCICFEGEEGRMGECVCLLSKPWEQGALQGGESGPPTIHMLLLFTQTPSLPKRIITLPTFPVSLFPSFFRWISLLPLSHCGITAPSLFKTACTIFYIFRVGFFLKL